MGEFSCIVLDLEWNQPLDAGGAIREPFFFDSEIIEIGALKLREKVLTGKVLIGYIADFVRKIKI